jgi:rhomboid protease GluP
LKDKINNIWVTLAFVAANIVVFCICEALGGSENNAVLIRMGAVSRSLVSSGEWWRLFAAVFLHIGLAHLFTNMVSLLIFGTYMEKILGHIRYAILYLAGGVLGYVFVYLCDTATGEDNLTAGASGAIFALLGGLIALAIFRREMVGGMSAMRVVIIVLLMLFSGFSNSGISFTGHLGGLLGGLIVTIMMMPTIKSVKKRRRRKG